MASNNELQFILKMRDEATAILKQHGSAAGGVGSQVDAASQSFGRFAKAAREAGAALATAFVGSKIVKTATDDFANYEAGMARVARTTRTSGDAVGEFEQSFVSLASTLKGVSMDKMQDFATIAGQLGVRGSASINQFVDTMSKLDAVFQIGEEGAVSIGRLLLITGEGASGVKTFANALTEVQLNTKANARELVAMTAGLAQATSGFKLSSAALLGLGAAAAQLNFEPSLMSNTTGQAMRQLRDAALNGTAGMRQLSAATGLTQEQFKGLIQNNPDQAFLAFLKVLKQMNDAGISTTGFLSQFQLQGVETQKVIGTLANNVDEVAGKIQEAKNAASNTSALDQQFAGFEALTKTSLAGVQEAWEQLKVDIGGAIAPIVNLVANGLTAAIRLADGAFRLVPSWGRTIAVSLAVGMSAFAAIKGTLAVFATLFGGIGPLIRLAFAPFTMVAGWVGSAITAIRGMAVIGPIVETITAVLGGLATAFGLPAIAVAALVTAVVAAGALIYAKWDAIRAELAKSPAEIWTDLKDKVSGALAAVVPTIQGWLKGLGNLMQAGVSSLWNTVFAVENIDWSQIGSNIRDGFLSAVATAARGASDYLHDWWSHPLWAKSGPEVSLKVKAATPDQINEAVKQTQAATGAAEAVTSGHGIPANTPPIPGNGNGTVVSGLNAEQLTSLGQLDDVAQKKANLTTQRAALKAANEQSDAQLQVLNLSRQDLAVMQAKIDIAQRQLDPMVEVTRELQNNINSAQAYTKEQQNQVAIQQRINDETLKQGVLTDENKAKITALMQEMQQAQINNAYKDQMTDLAFSLQSARALTTEQKSAVDLAKQAYDLRTKQGFSAGQAADVVNAQDKVNQAQQLSQLRGQLDPITEATRQYQASVEALTRAYQSGQISGQQFGQMINQLNNQTQAARDPWGAQVKSMQQAIQLESISGDYAEADRAALQTKFEMQEKGLQVSQQQYALLQQYNRSMQDYRNSKNNGFDGFVNSIPSIQQGLGDLQKDFASGLGQAISQTLQGQKGAFTGFLSSLGGKMIDFGVNQLMKQGLQMFGFGEGDKNALGSAQSAASQLGGLGTSLSTANIQAGVVNVSGGLGGLPGASGLSGIGTTGQGVTADASALGVVNNAGIPAIGSVASSGSGVASVFQGAGGGGSGLFGALGLGGAGLGLSKLFGGSKAGNPTVTTAGLPNMPMAALPGGLTAAQKASIAQDPSLMQKMLLPMGQAKVDSIMSGMPGATRTANGGWKMSLDTGVTSKALSGTTDPLTGKSPFGDLSGVKFATPVKLDSSSVQDLSNQVTRGSANFMNPQRMQEMGLTPNGAQIGINGMTARVNEAAAPHFQGLLDDLHKQGYDVGSLGGYSNRMIRGSIFSASQHAYGNAIDINPASNPMQFRGNGPLHTNLPPNISDIAAKNGLTWGGDWKKRQDPMHFEWTGAGRNQGGVQGQLQQGRNAMQNNPMQAQMQQQQQMQQQMAQQQMQQAQQQQQAMQQAMQQQQQYTQQLTQVGSISQQVVQPTQMFSTATQGLTSQLAQGPGITQNFTSSLSSMFQNMGGMGGGGFGGLFSGLGGLAGGAFHTGGLVSGGGVPRMISLAHLARAGRYHSGGGQGLVGDEYPAILQRSERVLTAADNKRSQQVMNGMSQHLQPGQAGSAVASSKGSRAMAVTFNVNTPDASSFRKSQSQMMADMQTKMQRVGS